MAEQQITRQGIFPAGSPVNVLSNGHSLKGTVVPYSDHTGEYTVQLKVSVIRAHAMWVRARKVRAS